MLLTAGTSDEVRGVCSPATASAPRESRGNGARRRVRFRLTNENKSPREARRNVIVILLHLFKPSIVVRVTSSVKVCILLFAVQQVREVFARLVEDWGLGDEERRGSGGRGLVVMMMSVEGTATGR